MLMVLMVLADFEAKENTSLSNSGHLGRIRDIQLNSDHSH